jgi:hypothetical protein
MERIKLMRDFNANDIRVVLLRPVDPEWESKINGKLPYKKGWQNEEIHDEEEMDTMAMISESIGCGYGVLCNNLLVIDVDPPRGGVDSFQKLYEDCPEIASAGLIVETGSGGGSKHYYFKLSPDIRVSMIHKDYPGIDFKHTGFVVGPGSMHRKGTVYTVLSGSVEEIDEAPASLVAKLKPREYEKVEHDGERISVTNEVLRDALKHVHCYDEYSEWIAIGMAIHHATSGDGLSIWDEWSQQSANYKEHDIHYKWGGFRDTGERPITVATIFKLASDNGWSYQDMDMMDIEVPELWYSWADNSKTITEQWESSVVEEESSEEGDGEDGEQEEEEDAIDHEFAKVESCPVNLTDIDLLSPPGFTGKLAKWIDSQCLNPRKYLAAMGAVYAVSAIAGLRYVGANARKSRTNMFVLGVADSATGKDAVLNAVRRLVFEAGMGASVYGQIKSDREVTVNLIEHQAANYMVDEIGERLAKVLNSRNNGATHLDGVIATFMEVYSKSGSAHIVGGDTQREIKKDIMARISAYQKRIDENEDKDGSLRKAVDDLTSRLDNDGKIDKPFLSLLGFTTPEQLREIMTVQNVKTGFLGRAMLCLETEEFPIERENHEVPDIPIGMRMQLSQMAWGGSTWQKGDRVEVRGDSIPVGYTAEADELLKGFAKWQRNYARHQRETEGSPFGPLYKRMTEKATKISLVLGIPDGTVTAEHVQWAAAAAWMDAQSKIEMVSLWDKNFAKKANLKETLFKEIKNKPGCTIGKLCSSRCLRDMDRDAVIEAKGKLIKEGLIREVKDKNKRTNAVILRYHPK